MQAVICANLIPIDVTSQMFVRSMAACLIKGREFIFDKEVTPIAVLSLKLLENFSFGLPRDRCRQNAIQRETDLGLVS